MPAAATYDLPRLRIGLKPYRLYYFGRLRSTSDHAARLRRSGRLFAPGLVLTARQLAGRGRGKNTWWSSGGVLTVTFALPIHERLAPQELPLIAGLAVRQAAAELTGNDGILLKWPNDVLFEDRKLAGLLCERVSGVDLLGIGLNVNVNPREAPKGLRREIASLSGIAGRRFDMTDVLLAIASHLRHNIRKRIELPFHTFVRDYARYDALAGRRVTIVPGSGEAEISGICQGLDSAGCLLVRQRGKVQKIIAGMVTLISPPGRNA
jgi:BirA family biotin operon repressor/biotin-[acetyl-CoA-carboxylase] ligase